MFIVINIYILVMTCIYFYMYIVLYVCSMDDVRAVGGGEGYQLQQLPLLYKLKDSDQGFNIFRINARRLFNLQTQNSCIIS